MTTPYAYDGEIAIEVGEQAYVGTGWIRESQDTATVTPLSGSSETLGGLSSWRGAVTLPPGAAAHAFEAGAFRVRTDDRVGRALGESESDETLTFQGAGPLEPA
jgi:hypothetical protein